ncbi:MAG TPA: DUF3817 domain-containing protein [Candidatus Lumbricidophila sp.]|nr:DUF3817 domain-containing protein [Candidatus Lumbricidophila sp.]
MVQHPLTLFRTLAIAEAISWTLLIGALILRASTGWAPAVAIGGGIHGFIFLAFCATSVLIGLNNRWPIWVTVVTLVSAVIPYATVPAEVWLQRSGRLAAAWRLEQTDDPRDATATDRLMRWFLRRPWVLAALIVVALVALFTVLLIIGPPGGTR